jgi:hypothetical protein
MAGGKGGMGRMGRGTEREGKGGEEKRGKGRAGKWKERELGGSLRHSLWGGWTPLILVRPLA